PGVGGSSAGGGGTLLDGARPPGDGRRRPSPELPPCGAGESGPAAAPPAPGGELRHLPPRRPAGEDGSHGHGQLARDPSAPAGHGPHGDGGRPSSLVQGHFVRTEAAAPAGGQRAGPSGDPPPTEARIRRPGWAVV